MLADPGAHADDVRADVREAARLGARGVPFFVLDRAYGALGVQPVEGCGPDGCAAVKPDGRGALGAAQ